MPQKSRFAVALVHAGQGTLLAALCLSLAVPPAFAVKAPEVPAQAATAIPSSQRIDHALNRFTFGPRPGDQAAVAALGLDRWFEQQLHPERISDAALDARLAQYPAMRLPQDQLMARFPPPGVLRQMQRGDDRYAEALAGDPVERAIYADAERSYALRVKKQAQAANPTQAMENKDSSLDSSLQATAEGASNATPRLKRAAEARLTLGSAAQDDVQTVLAMDPDRRFERLVAMSPEEMLAFRNGVRGPNQLRLVAGMTPEQTEAIAAMQAPARVVSAEALGSRLMRDLYSERQLQAVMTDFWLNHFSVYVRKNQNEPYYLPSYLNEAILPHAFGSFEDLLVATAKSPAMLVYLDNWESVGPHSRAAQRADRAAQARPGGVVAKRASKGINENYARELMELHTLGVRGGYTQQDVIEVAKCFTGWTVERPARGGEFRFDPDRHEPGDKVVLGHTIREGGMNEGLEVLHLLATSPATARLVSHKLAVRFVSDDPPAAVEQAMVNAYMSTGGDMRAVLTAMYKAPGFWSAGVYRAKVKTPIELLASAVRASGADVNAALPLVQSLQRLGMPMYGMQTPNGYSWAREEWVSSNALLTRMNFALVLAGNRLPGTRLDWAKVLGTADPSPATEGKLEILLLGEPATTHTRETVLAQFGNPQAQREAEQAFIATPSGDEADDMQAATGEAHGRRVSGRPGGRSWVGRTGDAPETPLGTMAGLLLGSPEFQRR